MGDRSNIVVVQPDNSRIWLYGHWMGEDNFRVAGDVLSRRERWNDSPYLTRMLFSKMIEGDYDSDTGYGISNTMCDNEYFIVVIDPKQQTVHLEQYLWGQSELTEITLPVSFEDFFNAYLVSESFNNLAVNMSAKLTTA